MERDQRGTESKNEGKWSPNQKIPTNFQEISELKLWELTSVRRPKEITRKFVQRTGGVTWKLLSIILPLFFK